MYNILIYILLDTVMCWLSWAENFATSSTVLTTFTSTSSSPIRGGVLLLMLHVEAYEDIYYIYSITRYYGITIDPSLGSAPPPTSWITRPPRASCCTTAPSGGASPPTPSASSRPWRKLTTRWRWPSRSRSQRSSLTPCMCLSR